jgi:hypothetical protein
MADKQGTSTETGRPALNIERIYSTTVTAEEFARTLADHFRAQSSRHRSTAPAGTAR